MNRLKILLGLSFVATIQLQWRWHRSSDCIYGALPGIIVIAMQPNKSVHPRARLSSFGYAFRGIASLIHQEPNAKLHAVATLAAITLGFIRHLTRLEWTVLVIAIALVWMAEAFNTCIEMLCDLWCKGEYHPQVRRVKDISAAAVLFVSIAAAITGIIIFLT